MPYVTWPNALSALRLPLAAAFVATDSTPARGAILVVGAFSDWVDGRLARRTGRTTRTGEILDPVADKLFVLAVLGSFVAEGRVELWELLLLLTRDLYTTAAFATALALRLPIRFRSRRSGKLVTMLQLLTALAILLRPDWVEALAIIIAAASVYAVVDYTRTGLGALRRTESRR